jgi:hypothetical protein
MLAVASNSDAQQNEVPLAENADVIERLLLILRDAKVSLKTDAEFTQLFEMVRKYDIPHVSNYLALEARTTSMNSRLWRHLLLLLISMIKTSPRFPSLASP